MSASTPSTTTPVSTLRVHVVLPKAVVKAIDQLVGQRNRSRFLTAAAEREISRRALIEAAPVTPGLPPPTTFKTDRASVPPSHLPSEEELADALDEAHAQRQRRAQVQDPAE